MSKSIVVLIDGKKTSIPESKFKYFKEAFSAELIAGQPDKKETKAETKEVENESLLDKVNPFKTNNKKRK